MVIPKRLFRVGISSMEQSYNHSTRVVVSKAVGVCYDLAKQLSHYLISLFFSFLLLLR